MKPATRRHLLCGIKLIAEGRKILGIGLNGLAAPEAYLAAFHALIHEETDNAPRIHKGVHVEFSRLALQHDELGQPAMRHLSSAYDWKAIHDHEGPREIPGTEAEIALQATEALIRGVCAAIGAEYATLASQAMTENS